MSQRVSFYVQKYIEGDPTIKVGLQRGLISSRILTKHIIQEEREFKGSFDDVRNAVRKYSDEKVPLFDFKNAYNAFRGSHIDVKSKLGFIEIKRNSNIKDTLNVIDKLFSKSEKFVRILNNAKSFQLVASEEDIDKVSKLIKPEDMVSTKKEISIVTVYLDPSVKYTPGIYFLIMGQISMNQINIFDVSSYESEFSIYVDEKDGSRVHLLLHDLTEYQKKFCKPKR